MDSIPSLLRVSGNRVCPVTSPALPFSLPNLCSFGTVCVIPVSSPTLQQQILRLSADQPLVALIFTTVPII